eukprot:2042923-Ditylum_brightwellii.AAC.1
MPGLGETNVLRLNIPNHMPRKYRPKPWGLRPGEWVQSVCVRVVGALFLYEDKLGMTLLKLTL